MFDSNPNIPDGKLPTQWTPVNNGSEEYSMYISEDGAKMRKGLMGDKEELLRYLTKRINGTLNYHA